MIENHKPVLSFRERVDAGLPFNQPINNQHIASSKSDLNLDLHAVSNNPDSDYVKKLQHKLLELENKCVKL